LQQGISAQPSFTASPFSTVVAVLQQGVVSVLAEALFALIKRIRTKAIITIPAALIRIFFMDQFLTNSASKIEKFRYLT
jgi:anaerobic C4-dicarboxylate transporter